MSNVMNMDNITIEQFAAYLDGNLPENEMRIVAEVIDNSQELSDILGGVMAVEDYEEVISGQDEVIPAELFDIDFNLPVVPVATGLEEHVELTAVASDDNIVLATANDHEVSSHIDFTSAETEEAETDPLSHLPSEPAFLDSPLREEHDMIDLGDFA